MYYHLTRLCHLKSRRIYIYIYIYSRGVRFEHSLVNMYIYIYIYILEAYAIPSTPLFQDMGGRALGMQTATRWRGSGGHGGRVSGAWAVGLWGCRLRRGGAGAGVGGGGLGRRWGQGRREVAFTWVIWVGQCVGGRMLGECGLCSLVRIYKPISPFYQCS